LQSEVRITNVKYFALLLSTFLNLLEEITKDISYLFFVLFISSTYDPVYWYWMELFDS